MDTKFGDFQESLLTLAQSDQSSLVPLLRRGLHMFFAALTRSPDRIGLKKTSKLLRFLVQINQVVPHPTTALPSSWRAGGWLLLRTGFVDVVRYDEVGKKSEKFKVKAAERG